MAVNVFAGICTISIGLLEKSIFTVMLGAYFIAIPFIMYYVSKEKEKIDPVQKLDKQEQEYIKEIGRKTWKYFEKYLNKENNYLIPDNGVKTYTKLRIRQQSKVNVKTDMMLLC